MVKNKVSRQKYFEDRLNNYIHELNTALAYERSTDFNLNEAEEFQENITDILQGIQNCTPELIKENLALTRT